MTLYLAGGALLYGSSATGDFNTGAGGIDIEGCVHGMIRIYNVSNTKILGRGIIDANGKAIRAQNDTKINLIKIERSSNILIDGIVVRDPSFWNTLIYRSDLVTIQNYKMINCRPTTTTYNNTDGVNFDESTNGKLSNAFLYTGDDSLATKNEEPSGTINTKNIIHEKVVCLQQLGRVQGRHEDHGHVHRRRHLPGHRRGQGGARAQHRRLRHRGRSEHDVREHPHRGRRFDDDRSRPRHAARLADGGEHVDHQGHLLHEHLSDVKKPISFHGKSASVNIVGVHFTTSRSWATR